MMVDPNFYLLNLHDITLQMYRIKLEIIIYNKMSKPSRILSILKFQIVISNFTCNVCDIYEIN